MRVLSQQNRNHLNNLSDNSSLESIEIAGVSDIAFDFDVILFSADKTLSRDNKILPAGAVIVPHLRRMGKKLGIFSVAQDIDKMELVNQINHLGSSFSPDDILVRDDLNNIETKFPLTTGHRILMVCGDVIDEVTLAKNQHFTSLLITPRNNDQASALGISPHYVASTV